MNTEAHAAALALRDHGLYQQPTHTCDMVMKGGVTSGIVYPLAACELAKTYTFKNIGGTSAGALAAAVIAAAEHGRHIPTGGFSQIAKLPADLGDGTTLFNLFQPQRSTRSLYNLATAVLGSPRGRVWRVLFAAATNFPLALIVGALPAVVLTLAVTGLDGWRLGLGIVFVLITLALGVVGAIAFAAYVVAARELPANFYGLCSGMEGGGKPNDKVLTHWLSTLLERTAGMEVDNDPLTFGDLWGTRDPHAQREVNLEVITTSISHGRPYKIPFDTSTLWLFSPTEFRRLFPKHVVDWMVEHPRRIDNPERFAEKIKGTDLVPMPDAAFLPVVVATRMSLSFPFLISAVPLYTIDSSRRAQEDRKPEPCWFSDGGITSNLPVHFFDAPLPRWPTFAINLRSFHPDYPPQPNEAENSFLPVTNRAGTREWWNRFGNTHRAYDPPPATRWKRCIALLTMPPIAPTKQFVGAILNTMQNWRDTMQVYQPGYRDRVVHISIGEGEGGTNLKMPPERTEALSERGRIAGVKLRNRFAGIVPSQTTEGQDNHTQASEGWDNHRWVRYRSTMSVLERMLKQLVVAYRKPEPGDRPYAELIRRSYKTMPRSYRWRRIKQRDFAAVQTEKLIHRIERWNEESETFGEGAPKPDPELRITPRM